MDSQAIINQLIESKRKKIKVVPQYTVRASEIGHPCERYLVHSIVNWADRKPHDPEVEFIFEGGRLVEERAIQDFIDAGFIVYQPESDKAIMESRPRISGHIDIRVDFGDGIYTGEIKGLNVQDWEKLNSLEDFFRSKKPWIQKYPAQLMTYLYIKGEEMGFFYLKSLPRFQPKFIWINLDLGYMESILQKTERVEKHVKEGTFPDHIDNPDMCEICAFCHVCLPPINRSEMEMIFDDDFISMVERHEELKPMAREYNEIDELLKKRFNERERLLVGDFMILGKRTTRKAYSVAEMSYMRYQIKKIS